MNSIRQRLISLRNRARDLQTTLRRWALYDDSLPREMKEDLLSRMTPAEETAFETDLELTKTRLRPVSVQLKTVSKWYDYVLETINEQLERGRLLLEQGRNQECLAVLADVDGRLLSPNEDTLGFVFRSCTQHASHEYHQKLATIDAIIRDLYLPTVKLAHQRGAVAKEGLSQTPLAYLTDGPEGMYTWRQHAQQALNQGRRLPVTMLAVPRKLLAQPWNLTAIAHEVGLCLYSQFEMNWEFAGKLQTESANAGVSPQTAGLWAKWHETVFADVFGTLKLGPAYISGMIELLGVDAIVCTTVNANSPVPPAYVRWHVMLQTLQLMQFPDQARDLFNQIHLLCGDPASAAARSGPALLLLVSDSRGIAGLAAFSPLHRLGGARLIDIAQPFMAVEWQTAVKVRDVLQTNDERFSNDESFSWAEPVTAIPAAAHIALAGLRLTYDATPEFEASRRTWVRFWCLMQCLTGHTEPTREREDREFALGDAILRTIAQQPAQVHTGPRAAVPMMAGARA
ncbi:MAG: hypothetical protein AABZ08_00010 [Planctomycetota bacterium]